MQKTRLYNPDIALLVKIVLLTNIDIDFAPRSRREQPIQILAHFLIRWQIKDLFIDLSIQLFRLLFRIDIGLLVFIEIVEIELFLVLLFGLDIFVLRFELLHHHGFLVLIAGQEISVLMVFIKYIRLEGPRMSDSLENEKERILWEIAMIWHYLSKYGYL